MTSVTSSVSSASVVTGQALEVAVVVEVVDVAIRGGGAGPHRASRRQEKYN